MIFLIPENKTLLK